MEAKVLLSLKPHLDEFLGRFGGCMKTERTRGHFRTYVTGQLSDLERKSVEPIALEANVSPRTLQEFLNIHSWDEEGAARQVRRILMREHASGGAICVVDESSFPKKGKETPGVVRQWCGQSGKVDNCVQAVSLGYVNPDENFHALMGSELYLPKEWISDEARRKKAGIPEDIVYRSKLQIALELLSEATKEGVVLRWVVADSLYGRSLAFRKRVKELGPDYVVEIPCNTRGWLKKDPSKKGQGIAGGNRPAKRVDRLTRLRQESWPCYRVKDTEKGPEVWRVYVSRFFPLEAKEPGEECWLLVARNVLSGEVKYLLSSASAEVSPEALLRVAFSRWHIERIFQDGKGEVGMGHFEVRSYRSVRRHFLLTMVSFLFLARETAKLREEKKRMAYFVSGEAGHGAAA